MKRIYTNNLSSFLDKMIKETAEENLNVYFYPDTIGLTDHRYVVIYLARSDFFQSCGQLIDLFTKYRMVSKFPKINIKPISIKPLQEHLKNCNTCMFYLILYE